MTRLTPMSCRLTAAAMVGVLFPLSACVTDDGDAWVVSTPEAEGMDSATLEGARSYAFADGKNTQGVVVVRHGKIVAEWYGADSDASRYAASWSMAKSMTSALVGIALEEGAIPSLDVSIASYVPSWAGTDHAAITLRDVLHMSSGLDWDETYNLGSDVQDLVFSMGDSLDVVYARPVAAPPGTVFNYSSGDTMLLSAVLQSATGMSVADYAQQKLFGPLGITGAQWWRDTSGVTLTFCCVDMRSRDFARFGELYLRQGRWHGRTVVPEAWVQQSLTPSPAYEGYGFQWWLLGRDDARLPSDTYAAIGVDEQYIYVIPSRDLVIVRSGLYFKYDGEPVADPYLYYRYPNAGIIMDAGTYAPDSWDDAAFLMPILDSITAD